MLEVISSHISLRVPVFAGLCGAGQVAAPLSLGAVVPGCCSLAPGQEQRPWVLAWRSLLWALLGVSPAPCGCRGILICHCSPHRPLLLCWAFSVGISCLSVGGGAKHSETFVLMRILLFCLMLTHTRFPLPWSARGPSSLPGRKEEIEH